MVSINYSAREVCCKIVYYGPGLSGKTTNLQYVHSKVPQTTRGKLISLATEADRTLYFDFLPLNIGSINGFTAKFQLYTVPGQVYYNATRKLVLRGVDGVVFVADSQPDKMDDNMESLLNLEENLIEYGYDLTTLPTVIQYNKRDIPGVLSVEQMTAQLNKRNWPYFEASATIGNGVFDTLKLIIKLVLDKAKQTSAPTARPTSTVAATPAPTMPPAQAPPAAATPAAPVQPQPDPAPEAPTAQPVYASPVETAPRPYPGTEAAASAQPAPAVTAPPPTPAPYPGDREPVAQSPAVAQTEPTPAPPAPADAAPQMAPSLRKKPEKKRGFFKRLFGIK